MTSAMPPRWAEAALRLLLMPRDRETVPGDLLEEYRESIHPARGRRAADRWYVRQVAGFAWRGNILWAALFSAAFVGRTALDWRVPTTDFYARSVASTAIAVSILLCAGFWFAWRTQSLRSGAVAGVLTTSIAAVMNAIGRANSGSGPGARSIANCPGATSEANPAEENTRTCTPSASRRFSSRIATTRFTSTFVS